MTKYLYRISIAVLLPLLVLDSGSGSPAVSPAISAYQSSSELKTLTLFSRQALAMDASWSDRPTFQGASISSRRSAKSLLEGGSINYPGLAQQVSDLEILNHEIADYEAMETVMQSPGGPTWQWVGGQGPAPDVRRLGVFGITADPVQNGHKELVEAALQEGVDDVVLVLAFDNVSRLKTTIATLAERMAMLRRTFGDNPKIYFAFSKGKGARYIDFLRAIKAQRPEVKPVFIMGVDSFQTMAAYNSNEDFATFVREGAEFQVYPRYGDEQHLRRLWVEDPQHWPGKFTSTVRFAELTAVPASSSLVRVLAGDGDSLWKELVPRAVAQIIELRALYQQQATIEARVKAYREYSDWISTKIQTRELKEMVEWRKIQSQEKNPDRAGRSA